MTVEDTIRDALSKYGNLPVSVSELADDDDLYQAGLSSHASVNIMLALEDALEVEFPDSLLKKETFQSVSSMRDALDSLGTDAGAE